MRKISNYIRAGNAAATRKELYSGEYSDKDIYNMLWIACDKGSEEIVRIILEYCRERGIDIGAGDKNYLYSEGTAIMPAARNGNVKILQLLEDYVPNYVDSNKYDVTALMVAAEEGNTEAFKFLLQHGHCPNWESEFGGTALKNAIKMCTEDDTECVDALLNYQGIDVNLGDESTIHTCPTIITAIRYLDDCPEHIRILKKLLELGANINSRDMYGDTALAIAVYRGSIEKVRVLLNYGADTEIRNKSGDKAIDIAKSEGVKDIIELLEEHIKKGENR